MNIIFLLNYNKRYRIHFNTRLWGSVLLIIISRIHPVRVKFYRR